MGATLSADLEALLRRPPVRRSNILDFGLPTPKRTDDRDLLPSAAKRTRIWEFQHHLHCSIIGTCLSAGELRHLLVKLKLAPKTANDHHLHEVGVLLAGRRDAAAKLLNKALDQRHRLTIRRFEQAATEADVRSLWRQCVQEGEIPGGYWAALSHPAAMSVLIKDVFAEVHMLSHLVGAANRADIRRLADLEAERIDLQEKVARQQSQLHEVVVSRDARIRGLSDALSRRIGEERRRPDAEADGAPMAGLIADLERRGTKDRQRILSLEGQLQATRAALAAERQHRHAAETAGLSLRQEIDAIEGMLAPTTAAPSLGEFPSLAGASVLYVGGRTGQAAGLRDLAEGLGALFLHHDGGIEERSGLLPGLVAQADLVLFPVDCVSHDAMTMAKRLCRQAGKRYEPLRTSGMSSFLAALFRWKMADADPARAASH